MNKVLILIFLGLFLTGFAFVQAENDTAVCDSDNLDLCTDETSCTGIDKFWYNDICNTEAEVLPCDGSDLSLCTSGDDCTAVEGFWYDDVCNLEDEAAVCDADNLNLCEDETSCTDIDGFWYDDVCNVEEEATCNSDNLNLCEDEETCEDADGEWNNDTLTCEGEEEDDDSEENGEDETKVCCMRQHTRSGRNPSVEIKYNYMEESNCLNFGQDDNEDDDDSRSEKTSEIVNDELCGDRVKARNRLIVRGIIEVCPEECTCAGSTIKCMLASGREMTVYAGRSGNTIVQIKGVNMSTDVTLYRQDNALFGDFNGVTKEVKVFPDELKAKLKARMKTKFFEEEFEIELRDDGVYEFKAKKKARLFWVIPIGESVEAEIDSETGEFFKLKKGPWWGWLANDVEE